MKEESISEKYYDLLTATSNPVSIMVNFIKEVLELETVTGDFYPFVGRLLKLYGKEVVFSSILSLATSDIDSSNLQNVKNYLSSVCKKIFMEKFKSFYPINDLTQKAAKLYRRFYARNRR